MIRPLFAKEKQLERNLTQNEQAGAQSLHVATPSDFQTGDRVFCSESDGSAAEYLGAVTTVGASTLTLSHPLATARDTTARLWRAASFFQWETVAAEPLERRFREGVTVEPSVGGTLWAVRVADPSREDVLRFAGITRTHFAAFRAWLSAQVRGGLEEFTWVDESRNLAVARLRECDFEQIEKPPRVVALTLRLAVVDEGGYA